MFLIENGNFVQFFLSWAEVALDISSTASVQWMFDMVDCYFEFYIGFVLPVNPSESFWLDITQSNTTKYRY